MKKIKSILMAASLFVFCFNASAKSISDAARSAGSPSGSSRRPSSSSNYHSSSSYNSNDPCADDCTDTCTLTAAAIILTGWAALNLNVTYEDYPYQLYNPHYVINRSAFAKTVADEGNEDAESSLPEGKSSRFSFDAEALKLNTKSDTSGMGFAINFEGLLFPFVGPYCSFEHIIDTEAEEDENTLNNLKLGGQISIVQHDYICASFFVQWSHWFGEIKAIPSNGWVIGLDCRSYPVYPFTLGWRGSCGSYGSDNEITIIESDLQAGIIYRQFELFAGWKYFAIGSDGNYSDENARNGIYAGSRIHF